MRRSPDTPVAIVSKATTKEQRRFIGRLGELEQLAADPELQMPALMIIGEVVALSDTLHWFNPEAVESSQASDEQAQSVRVSAAASIS